MVIPGSELVRLDLPANPDVVGVARMVVAGAASLAGLPLDDRLDDVRLAVTEACNYLVRQGLMKGVHHRVGVLCAVAEASLVVRVEANFRSDSSVDATATAGEVDLDAEQEWGAQLLNALADGVELKDDSQTCAVTMTFNLGDMGYI